MPDQEGQEEIGPQAVRWSKDLQSTHLFEGGWPTGDTPHQHSREDLVAAAGRIVTIPPSGMTGCGHALPVYRWVPPARRWDSDVRRLGIPLRGEAP